MRTRSKQTFILFLLLTLSLGSGCLFSNDNSRERALRVSVVDEETDVNAIEYSQLNNSSAVAQYISDAATDTFDESDHNFSRIISQLDLFKQYSNEWVFQYDGEIVRIWVVKQF
jgi:hypothetical protein